MITIGYFKGKYVLISELILADLNRNKVLRDLGIFLALFVCEIRSYLINFLLRNIFFSRKAILVYVALLIRFIL